MEITLVYHRVFALNYVPALMNFNLGIYVHESAARYYTKEGGTSEDTPILIAAYDFI